MVKERIETIEESLVVVTLPEGDYSARAQLKEHWLDTPTERILQERRVTITMLKGEEIRTHAHANPITEYQVVAANINDAVEEFVTKVGLWRRGNQYVVNAGPRRRAGQAL